MGKSAGSPPPAPDPAVTAKAQGAANRETAIAQGQLNMVDQATPWGSLNYNQRGTGPDGTPLYSATTTLSPAQQAQLDQDQALTRQMGSTGQMLLTNAQNQLSQPISLEGLPSVTMPSEDARQQALARMLARAEPQFAQQREGVESRLASQGINVGSEAYTHGVDELNRSQNDYRLAADQSAGNEMAQLFGLQTGARQQGITERLLPRNTTINELGALTGGNQVQMPQFASTPQTGIAPTDVTGPTALAYQGQMNAYNQQNQQSQSNMQGLYGLAAAAGTAAMFF